MPGKSRYVIRAADHEKLSFRFRHPLGGDKSEIIMTMLASHAGLARVGVSLGRVPAGKEAFIYHLHHGEEEWVYILEGAATSVIDGNQEKVGVGDFIAYPPGVAHVLRNDGNADLVYLMGGEKSAVEIADFPQHGKRLLRTGKAAYLIDIDNSEPFSPAVEPVEKKPVR